MELANLLVGFGVVAEADRDWRQAEQYLLEAISLRIETGYNPNDVRNVLAEFYIGMGRLADAEQIIQAANATVEKLGAHEDLGEILRLEASLARSKGELDRAQQLGEHAAAELRRTKNPEILSVALADLSSVHTAKGDLPQAEKYLTEAGSGIMPEIRATVELARAELWIAEGHFPDAVNEAQKAAAAFDQVHLDGQAARAFVAAADALRMLNRNDEALAACREGEKRAVRTPNRLPIALAQLCSSDNAIPHELQNAIAKLQNPELALRLEYVRALRANRTGARNYRVQCEKLADAAAKLGYMTLSRSAASLGQ
jgi:tetratricopeptide (TPR) repeat protein